MTAWLGNSLFAFLLMTFVVFGWAAVATGNSLATTWRPAWQVVAYGCLLAATERFLDFALAGGALLSLGGFGASALCLSAIGLLAWRLRRAAMMVAQYPWLYEPAGPLGWREK